MFKGKEKKPSLPEVAHTRFEASVVWEGDGGSGASGMQIDVVGFLDTQEPRQLQVKTSARVAEPIRDVTVGVAQEGPRVQFSLTSGADIPNRRLETLNVLGTICSRGLTARQFLDGEHLKVS